MASAIFEGRNYTLEFRFADGFFERLPKLAVELVALKPALILPARRQLQWLLTRRRKQYRL